MSFNLWEMLAQLKIGIDIAPETAPEDVPHLRQPGHVPVYSVEREVGDRWELLLPSVSLQQLPEVVDELHWKFPFPVRLLEDGLPVFTCDII